MRTLEEINEKILKQKATVWTVEELKTRLGDITVAEAFAQVDVLCSGTFEPMESSGAMINLGHTDPPIKMRQCWLDGVPTYAGFGAVDLYIGATAMTETVNTNDSSEVQKKQRGGGHVIEDLIAGKSVTLRAIGQVTDCYPRASFEASITKETINQFYLYNPRNLYQNFIVGVNGEIVSYIPI